MRNIEIKAKLDDIEEIEKKAKQLSNSPLVVIEQHDIFFHIPSSQAERGGRLKLRQFKDGTAELIYYERPNVIGPKKCTYTIVNLDEERKNNLKEVLAQSNGVLGTIKKTRHLYMVGQTRIHIDRVVGLGNFLELEVVLSESDDPTTGKEIAENIMRKLGVSECSLLSGAYMDMMLQK